jgi:hypothetical protein
MSFINVLETTKTTVKQMGNSQLNYLLIDTLGNCLTNLFPLFLSVADRRHNEISSNKKCKTYMQTLTNLGTTIDYIDKALCEVSDTERKTKIDEETMKKSSK